MATILNSENEVFSWMIHRFNNVATDDGLIVCVCVGMCRCVCIGMHVYVSDGVCVLSEIATILAYIKTNMRL